MGRYYYDKKQVKEDCRPVSIFNLKKWGYLVPELYQKSGTLTWTHGSSGNKSSIGIACCTVQNEHFTPHVTFNYTQTDRHTEEKKEFDYEVRITKTPCNLGGYRWWFICPLTKKGIPCGRRVGVLYKGGDYYGCRHCYDLSYESRNEWKAARSMPWAALRIENKIDEIEKTIHKRYYQGKPTRKQRRIMRLERQLNYGMYTYAAAGGLDLPY